MSPFSKDMVKNSFPISCDFGNGAGGPLGPMIVKDHVHVVFAVGGSGAPGLGALLQAPHRHTHTGRGRGTCAAWLRPLAPLEAHPLAGAGEVWAHAVCDRLRLGTVRRLVGHPARAPHPMRQPWQVCLAQRRRGPVAAAPVAPPEPPGRLGMRRTARLLPP